MLKRWRIPRSALRALLALALPSCSAAGEHGAGVGGGAPPQRERQRFEVQPPSWPSCPGAPIVSKLVTGGSFVLALLEGDTRVWCWGECTPWKQTYPNMLVPYPTPLEGLEDESAIDVCGGGQFGCALLEGGRVWCWGKNVSGQLGNGEAGAGKYAPPGPVGGISGAVQLVCGNEHACVRKTDGTVWCWGHPGGFRDPISVEENAQPLGAELDEPGPVVDLVAGFYHTCAVLEDGRFACSGFATTPPIGLQMFEPIPYRKLSAGAEDTCALSPEGGVSCFTSVPSAGGQAVALERIAAVGGPLRDIWLNAGFACGLTANSAVLCSQRTSWVFWAPAAPDVREIAGLSRRALRLAKGNATSFACAVGRCVQCWGRNVTGNLGDGTTEPSYDPVMVDWGGP